MRKRGSVNVKQQEMQQPDPELVEVNQDVSEMHVVNTNRNEVWQVVTFVWPSNICLKNRPLAAIKIYICLLDFLKRRIFVSHRINQHMYYLCSHIFK